MKKNLLTIIILAFQVVQVVILGFILLSLMTTNSKAVTVLNDVAAAFELEQAGGLGGGVDPTSVNQDVALADRMTHPVNNGEAMTISLAMGADNKQHYAQVTVDLLMDATNPDYATYSGLLASMDSSIYSVVQTVVGKYTYDNVLPSQEAIRQEILQELWALFEDTTFIFNINLRIVPA